MKEETLHGTESPSAWVQRWSHLVTPGGVVLDVACGHGRHARWFHARQHPVVAVDRAPAAIDAVRSAAPGCQGVVADLENGPWPFAGCQFDAIIVTNYLWRALLPALLESLAPGGVLIYETFAQGNETVGKPSRPDFLLRTGELLQVCQALRVVGFEDGFQQGPQGQAPRFVQRIAAVRQAASSSAAADAIIAAPRYSLP